MRVSQGGLKLRRKNTKKSLNQLEVKDMEPQKKK